jgi:uncharacterized delta-60 repeat protein
VALQADGKIVAAGQAALNVFNTAFALARYTTAGAPDTTFGGGDGIVTTDINSNSDVANAVAIQGDGKIVAVGSNGTAGFAVARYLGDAPADVAEVAVAITGDFPDPASQYGVVSYSLGVSNAGPASAPSVAVHVTLPAGAYALATGPSQGTCTVSTGAVDCALGTIASAGSATIGIYVLHTSVGSLTTTAAASAAVGDSNTSNNSDTESTTVSAVACTMTGTGAPDMLTGTSGNDVICGVGGNDTINGADGHDVLIGGPGNDSITGGTGNDSLIGSGGADTLASTDGVSGNDVLLGGAGTDNCSGDPAGGSFSRDARTSCP